jgi:hypothetical protein
MVVVIEPDIIFEGVWSVFVVGGENCFFFGFLDDAIDITYDILDLVEISTNEIDILEFVLISFGGKSE